MTDREIIQGLIDLGNRITEQFLYVRCQPFLTAVMLLEFKGSPAFHALCVTMIDAEDGCDIKYVNPATGIERQIDGGDFLRAWEASGNYMVTISKVANGYNPQPINVDDIDLDANLEELTEAIAENAHDVWARARMDEGWTYGPVRNDRLKQHSDIVSYSQLPDNGKEYDRLMAMNTLRLVRRLGFDILNRNNP